MKAELPQSIVELSLQLIERTQGETGQRQQRQFEKLQENYKGVLQKISILMERQIIPATKVPEDIFQEKLAELQKEREHAKELINDFDHSVKEETDDLADRIKFTDALEERFKKEKDRDARLTMLHRLGQRFELKDGVLTVVFAEPYNSFLKGKERLEAELGTLRPLECGLAQVESGIRAKATLLWCRRRDSNSHIREDTRS